MASPRLRHMCPCYVPIDRGGSRKSQDTRDPNTTHVYVHIIIPPVLLLTLALAARQRQMF